MWKDHHCCGYTINCTFYCKNYESEKVWYFIGVYIINRTLHGRLKIQNFPSCVEKYLTRSLRSLMKYFSTLKEKFRISAWPCNILIHARVQPQRFHLKGHTIGFHPQIRKLKWELIHLQVRWVSLYAGVSVVTHSFTVKINLNYQGTCKWLFI